LPDDASGNCIGASIAKASLVISLSASTAGPMRSPTACWRTSRWRSAALRRPTGYA